MFCFGSTLRFLYLVLYAVLLLLLCYWTVRRYIWCIFLFLSIQRLRVPAFCCTFSFSLLFNENEQNSSFRCVSQFVYIFCVSVSRNFSYILRIFTNCCGFQTIYLFRNSKCRERKLFDVELKLFCLLLLVLLLLLLLWRLVNFLLFLWYSLFFYSMLWFVPSISIYR